jgi:ankyrin repeat protein
MSQEGETALISSCKYGHKEVCVLLLSRGADVNIKDDVFDIFYYSLVDSIVNDRIILYHRVETHH